MAGQVFKSKVIGIGFVVVFHFQGSDLVWEDDAILVSSFFQSKGQRSKHKLLVRVIFGDYLYVLGNEVLYEDNVVLAVVANGVTVYATVRRENGGHGVPVFQDVKVASDALCYAAVLVNGIKGVVGIPLF